VFIIESFLDSIVGNYPTTKTKPSAHEFHEYTEETPSTPDQYSVETFAAQLTIVIADHELELLFEVGAPDLLLRSLKRCIIGYVKGDNLLARKCGGDENVCTKKLQTQMALAWSLKKLLQEWEFVGPGRLLTMYLRVAEQAQRMSVI